MIGSGEYIGRDAAIEAMYKDAEAYPDHTFWTSQFEALMGIPAADVRPVRRGKWSKELHPRTKYNQFRCSVCGKFSGQDEEGWIWKPNFCPSCGADMRGESDV